MNKQTHYGTVTHWFRELQRGSILSDDHGGQRIYIDARSLSLDYLLPASGDRISFDLFYDEKNRLCAKSVALLPPLVENERTEVSLAEWDFQQNGGYGIHNIQKTTPIFILGQFLNDQTRVPEEGETLEGRLVKHSNGQWLMTEIDIIEKEPASPEVPPEIMLPPETLPSVASPSETQPEHLIKPAYSAAKPLPHNKVLSGHIVSWDDEKGYGFIHADERGQAVFFHISAFHYSTRRPQVGQPVSFYCNRPIGGEPQKAIKVVLRGHEASLFSDRPYDSHGFNLNMKKLLCFGAPSTAYLLAVAFFSVKLAIVYLLASIAAFWLYRNDKQTAVTQSQKPDSGYIGRIPEQKLHQISLIGGWPGALLARALFNHKTRKTSFIRIFWVVAVLNIAITYAILIHYTDNPIASFLKN